MDVLRTLLLFGLVVLVWKLPLSKTRPVRDFLMWGASYPLLLILLTGWMLVLWDLVGESYGLQNLFFDDNGMVQFLNGAIVVLFFAYATFSAIVLLPGRETWLRSVELSARVLGAMTVEREGRSTTPGLPH